MQSKNRFLDDFAKIMTNAAGAARSVGQEMETMVRQQAERVMANFDVVPRDEFDALKARVAKLEQQSGGAATKKSGAPKTKTKSKAKSKAKASLKTARAKKPPAR